MSLTPTHPARHVCGPHSAPRAFGRRGATRRLYSLLRNPDATGFAPMAALTLGAPLGRPPTTAGVFNRSRDASAAGRSPAVRLSHAVPCGASTARGRVVERVSPRRRRARPRRLPEDPPAPHRVAIASLTVVPRAAPRRAGACAQTTTYPRRQPPGFLDLTARPFLSPAGHPPLPRVSPPRVRSPLPTCVCSFRSSGCGGLFCPPKSPARPLPISPLCRCRHPIPRRRRYRNILCPERG